MIGSNLHTTDSLSQLSDEVFELFDLEPRGRGNQQEAWSVQFRRG